MVYENEVMWHYYVFLVVFTLVMISSEARNLHISPKPQINGPPGMIYQYDLIYVP